VPASGLTASELAETWVDAAEAGLRFWGRLGQLAFQSVAAVVAERREGDVIAAGAHPVQASSAERTILVEAEAGQPGLAVFIVENSTLERFSVSVDVSAFVDAEGREARPKITFRPEVITLDPGEQTVVQATVAVDETLAPGVRYDGDISVPGLPGTRIPIVVRRSAGRQTKAKTRAA
jgi:hypothetical protein